MANKCKECGCQCKQCLSSSHDHDIQLHVEIENLKQKLLEKEDHIVMMETNFLNEANKFPSGEIGAIKEELLTWQDKYKRLYEAHRRVQRVNQGLEDKLLKLVDVCETDKSTLTRDVATLSRNLAEANYAVKKLTEDNERYKNDVNLAIQFLQCKQTNFVAHRFDSLPSEVQTQVSAYMNNKRKPEEKTRSSVEPKSIKVPIPTFPPTAMVYSVPKTLKEADQRTIEYDSEQPHVDIVSAAIMAKVLEERQKERALVKHCDTCTCAKNLKIIYEVSHHHVGSQTGGDNIGNSTCLKCNEPLAGGVQILKPRDENLKKLSPYPNLMAPLPLEATPNVQNVVKVQPNNFLLEKNDKSQRIPLARNVNKDLIDFNEVTLTTVNEKAAVHHLKSSPETLIFAEKDEEDKEKNTGPPLVVSHNNSSETVKGPRYASLRLQTGSNNILLDNAHNNVVPVLYTRSHQRHEINTRQQQQHTPSQKCHLDSSKKQLHDSSSMSSYDSKQISVVSENSTQHKQRIFDWVQVTVENDNVSSPDNSRSEELPKIIDPKKEMEIRRMDKARYAEMEENVKRFLFGESDFWKTVEIGKLKYKSYQEHQSDKTKSTKISREGSRTTSHTETEI